MRLQNINNLRLKTPPYFYYWLTVNILKCLVNKKANSYYLTIIISLKQQ